MQHHATINRKSSTIYWMVSFPVTWIPLTGNSRSPYFLKAIILKRWLLYCPTALPASTTVPLLIIPDFTNSDFSLVVWPQNKKPSCR